MLGPTRHPAAAPPSFFFRRSHSTPGVQHAKLCTKLTVLRHSPQVLELEMSHPPTGAAMTGLLTNAQVENNHFSKTKSGCA